MGGRHARCRLLAHAARAHPACPPRLQDVNFGESYVPLDWLAGTFVANEEEYMARAAAAEARKGKKKA